MDNNYKKVLTDKKNQAEKIMNEEQIKKCNAAIHTASVASAAGGVIPFPVADAIPITAAQITMVIALGKIFNTNVTESVAKSIVSTAATTFVGRNLFKMIPIAGWIASASIAAVVTEALGWTVAVDFAKNAKGKWEREHNSNYNQNVMPVEEMFKENTQKANIDSLVNEAKAFLSGEKKIKGNEIEFDKLRNEIEKVVYDLDENHELRDLYDKLELFFAQQQ